MALRHAALAALVVLPLAVVANLVFQRRMSPAAILFRVELPTAVPIIGAGVRTALVLAVGTVPLGYALDAGGLGLPLFGAIKTDRQLVILTTAIMIACLALLLDWIGGVLQRAATPRGIR